jgi:hypothetical protein
MALELNTPFLEGGIKVPYFFNGRVLTAEDLRDLQAANAGFHRQLGSSMGEGVVTGMEVKLISSGGKSSLPAVSISKGMALNRDGEVLELHRDIPRLNLVRKPVIPRGGGGAFVACDSMDPTLIPTGTGVYILVAAPASGYTGKAPRHRPGDNGIISDCDYKYEQEGVQFKLVYLDITNSSLAGGSIGDRIRESVHESGAANRSQLRNLLAHLCLGTEAAAVFPTDLFSRFGSSAAVPEYGPLDELRKQGCLKNCDVPLALILWTGKGLEFVDMWPVRRKVHHTYIPTGQPYPVTERRTAELEATYLQFQDQMKALYDSASANNGNVSSITANDYFCFLPGVGMIRLDETESDKTGNNIQIKFFKDLTTRAPVFIEGVKLRDLLRQSFFYDPMEIGPEKRELIWLYWVRENMSFFEKNLEKSIKSETYLVFSSGYIPFRGEAQYNLSRWNYSHYGPGVADKFIIG